MLHSGISFYTHTHGIATRVLKALWRESDTVPEAGMIRQAHHKITKTKK